MQNAQKTYTTPKRQATLMAQQELNLSHGKTLIHSAQADDKICTPCIRIMLSKTCTTANREAAA